MTVITAWDLSDPLGRRSTAVIRSVIVDFGEARVRYTDETEDEWTCVKYARAEDHALATSICKDIQAATSQGCKEHGFMCWAPMLASMAPEPEESPTHSLVKGTSTRSLIWQWTNPQPDRYLWIVPPEKLHLAMKNPLFAMYDNRPASMEKEEKTLLARCQKERDWLRYITVGEEAQS